MPQVYFWTVARPKTAYDSCLGIFFNMTIDDPIKSVQQQIANEERSSDPVFPRVVALISTLCSSLPVEPVIQALGWNQCLVLLRCRISRR
jgi:hypothetical protein